jgi:hypothetical protein
MVIAILKKTRVGTYSSHMHEKCGICGIWKEGGIVLTVSRYEYLGKEED